MKARVLLVGANGQLGRDLTRLWPTLRPDDDLVALDHSGVEVSSLDSVRAAMAGSRPDVVVNTAAYHKTDVVENDPGRAFEVNAVGARNLAVACREANAALVHMSSDYVFSGEKGSAYLETDAPDPVNVYGVSKAAGEMTIRYMWPRHVIVRSSGLYGLAGSSGKGGNFVELMLRLAAERKPIKVVDDQTLTPTPTAELVRQIAALAATDHYGTFHATCQGECTWHGFAVEIFRQTGVPANLSPQSTAESGAAARRPRYSVLDNAALRRLGLDLLPEWRRGLAGYLRNRPG